jgi:hypothetical protein
MLVMNEHGLYWIPIRTISDEEWMKSPFRELFEIFGILSIRVGE